MKKLAISIMYIAIENNNRSDRRESLLLNSAVSNILI
jgi:hypothetical protein